MALDARRTLHKLALLAATCCRIQGKTSLLEFDKNEQDHGNKYVTVHTIQSSSGWPVTAFPFVVFVPSGNSSQNLKLQERFADDYLIPVLQHVPLAGQEPSTAINKRPIGRT